MSEFIKWLDIAISALQAQLKAFQELRAKLIAHPEIDDADSEAAAKLIAEALPKD